jgi:hypothetical protein
MTMIPTIVKADFYSMKISKDDVDKDNMDKDDGELFTFEYEEGYDINNKEHIEAFQNMEQIKAFHERMLSAYGRASLEFDRNDMTVKLTMKAPFEKIANFISLEFLSSGTLGKMTLLEFISMAASSMITTVKQECEDNKDMYA